MAVNVYTNELIFRWDPEQKLLLVIHPDREQFPDPLAEIKEETLDNMSWPNASKFVGEFVTLLVPDLRAKYESQFPK
jgi:hypothetical protein